MSESVLVSRAPFSAVRVTHLKPPGIAQLVLQRRGAMTPSSPQIISIDGKLSELNEKIMLLLPLVAKVDALTEGMETMNAIEKSAEFLAKKNDTILEKLDRQNSDMIALTKRVEVIRSDSSNGGNEMKLELDELEQYSQYLNIEVHGSVQEERENLLSKMNTLARQLELPALEESDLDAIHRLPPRARKEAIVIALFSSYSLKEKWMRNRSCLRNKETRIKIYNSLTPMNEQLLWLAQSRSSENNYCYVWLKNGHVFMRKARESFGFGMIATLTK